MKSDLEIAREARLRPIGEIAARLNIPDDAIEPYGRHKAKIGLDYVSCSPYRVPVARLAAAQAALGVESDRTA